MEIHKNNRHSNFGSSAPNLVHRQTKASDTVINVNGIEIGGKEIVIIAGPCAVENREQLLETAKKVHSGGANILRGGVYKPRTSPYSFQGLGEEGLKYLSEARKVTGLPVVTEVMDTRKMELVCEYTDIIQIGSRSMHNFPLLKEAGKCRKPVLFKRGLMATIDEYLLAAEYILSEGNQEVILCERGIRTFENYTRNTLDLSVVPILKRQTHLPVIVDPSHGTGHSWLVPAMAKAAIAAGADGIMVEVHNKPLDALSDGQQSLYPEEFTQLVKDIEKIALAVGRKIYHFQPSPA
ncbi:MAG: 3-deoxy-7-phosphoheptulonate synthase [Bacteroidales bacterium]|nr:3-deoxy-7-phosphoheptulonate synthase [Bacteroidales bacterium]